jgi:hypothetical protein
MGASTETISSPIQLHSACVAITLPEAAPNWGVYVKKSDSINLLKLQDL